MVLTIAALYVLFCFGVGCLARVLPRPLYAWAAIILLPAFAAFGMAYLEVIDFSPFYDASWYEFVARARNLYDDYNFRLVIFLLFIASGFAILRIIVRSITQAMGEDHPSERSILYFSALAAASFSFFVFTIEMYDDEIAVLIRQCRFIGHEIEQPSGTLTPGARCEQRLADPSSAELSHLPSQFRFRDKDRLWQADAGMIVVSLLLSPDETTEIKTSISSCYAEQDKLGYLPSGCQGQYTVSIRRGRPGPSRGTLYDSRGKIITGTSFSPERDGTCVWVDLPIRWSDDSTFVLFETGSLTPCDNPTPGTFRAWNLQKNIFIDVKSEEVKTFLKNPPNL